MTTKKQGKKKERSHNVLLFPPSSTCANDQYTPCKPKAPLLHLQYYCGYKKYNILQTISETLLEKSKTKLMVTKCPQLEVYVIVNFLPQVVFSLSFVFGYGN